MHKSQWRLRDIKWCEVSASSQVLEEASHTLSTHTMPSEIDSIGIHVFSNCKPFSIVFESYSAGLNPVQNIWLHMIYFSSQEIQKLKIYGSRHDIACYFLLVRHQSSFRSSAFYLEDIKHMFSMSAGLIHRIPLYKWKIKPVSGWGISITFAIVRYFPQSIVLSSC